MILVEQVRCPYCGDLDPFREESVLGGGITKSKTTTLDKVEAVDIERIWTGGVWDEAWSGFVPSSATLLGSPAGCGKSTLCMQVAEMMAKMSGKRAYYLSAEQSPGEIKLTTDRLRLDPTLFRVLTAMGGGADIDEGLLKEDPPACFIVDSVSALCGQKDLAGQLTVVKSFKKLAVKYNAPSFLISHVTKSQTFAGLESMQHEPDVVMTFDMPDKKEETELIELGVPEELMKDVRSLVPWKNRFGVAHRSTYLVMTEHGLIALPKKPEDKTSVGPKPETRPPPSDNSIEIGRSIHPAPEDVIEVDGNKWIKRKKKQPKPARAEAIEGSAPKRGRPEMQRTKEGQKAARQRRKEARA